MTPRSHAIAASRQTVLDAAAAVVNRVGFHNATIDDIARESGVSRASIYRWFGNRDTLLSALLQHAGEPFLARCSVIAVGPGTLAARIEAIVAAAVEGVCEVPWVKKAVRKGLLQEDFSIFATANKSIAGKIIASMLSSAEASGSWRAPDQLDRLIEWLLHQILVLGAADYASADEIRQRVAIYVMPVLRLPQRDPDSAAPA